MQDAILPQEQEIGAGRCRHGSDRAGEQSGGGERADHGDRRIRCGSGNPNPDMRSQLCAAHCKPAPCERPAPATRTGSAGGGEPIPGHTVVVGIARHLAALQEVVQAGHAFAAGQAEQGEVRFVDRAAEQRGKDVDHALRPAQRVAQPLQRALLPVRQLVQTRMQPAEARALCGLSSKRRYVRVEFADNGPGVPSKDKDKIFNPFFTSRAKGMGLGLSIVKGIVEAHRGRICEAGAEGKGAKFVLLLPVSESSDAR